MHISIIFNYNVGKLVQALVDSSIVKAKSKALSCRVVYYLSHKYWNNHSLVHINFTI